MTINDKTKIMTNSLGYNHLEVGDKNNPKTFRICGAPTRQEEARYEYCTMAAGWGTYHPGMGRCKLHGGSVAIGPRKPGGRYSRLFIGRMAAALDKLAQDDDDPLDLLPELEVQRALLVISLAKLDGEEIAPADDPVAMAKLAHALREKAERESKERKSGTTHSVEDKIQDSEASHTVGHGGIGNNELEGYLVVDARGEFSTPTPKSASKEITREDLELIREQVEGIVTTVTRIMTAKNQTALAAAEVTYILATMKEAIKEYVPEEKQRPFVEFLRARLGEKMGRGIVSDEATI